MVVLSRLYKFYLTILLLLSWFKVLSSDCSRWTKFLFVSIPSSHRITSQFLNDLHVYLVKAFPKKDLSIQTPNTNVKVLNRWHGFIADLCINNEESAPTVGKHAIISLKELKPLENQRNIENNWKLYPFQSFEIRCRHAVHQFRRQDCKRNCQRTVIYKMTSLSFGFKLLLKFAPVLEVSLG